MAHFLMGQAKIDWQAIRAHLGEWPVHSEQYRVCWKWPVVLQKNDLIILFSQASVFEQPYPQAAKAQAHVLVVMKNDFHLFSHGRHYHLTAKPEAENELAAWFAFIDCGFNLIDALVLALAWRDRLSLLADAWPTNLADFPRVMLPFHVQHAFAVCPNALGLYPLVPDLDWVKWCLSAGVRTIQLRMKQADARMRKKVALEAVQFSHHYADARLFINDDWRVALEVGAYGVHLGQEDLYKQDLDLNQLAKTGLRFGVSTHGYYEILLGLQLKPSYIAVGPIFHTATKKVSADVQGVVRLKRYAQLLKNSVPVVAIGGIHLQTLEAVLQTGVSNVALIQALLESECPQAVVARFNDLMA